MKTSETGRAVGTKLSYTAVDSALTVEVYFGCSTKRDRQPVVVVGTPGKLMDHAMEGMCKLWVTSIGAPTCLISTNAWNWYAVCFAYHLWLPALYHSIFLHQSMHVVILKSLYLVHGLHDLRIDLLKSSKPAGRLILNELDAVVIDEVDSLLSMSRKDELHHSLFLLAVLMSWWNWMMIRARTMSSFCFNIWASMIKHSRSLKEISIQGLHLKGSLMFTFNGFASQI